MRHFTVDNILFNKLNKSWNKFKGTFFEGVLRLSRSFMLFSIFTMFTLRRIVYHDRKRRKKKKNNIFIYIKLKSEKMGKRLLVKLC